MTCLQNWTGDNIACVSFSKNLLVCAGSQACTDGCQLAASVTVDALYVVMMDCKQWRQLDGIQPHDQVQGFTLAIRSLDGHLTAQLNASACLTHLLTQVKVVADCDVKSFQSHINFRSEIDYCPCSIFVRKNDTHGSCLSCILQKGRVLS